MFVHANGESEGMDPEKKPFRLIDFAGGETVALGMKWEDHAESCPNRKAGEHVEECECEKQDFSHSACQGCGEHLAGSRHAMTVFYSN